MLQEPPSTNDRAANDSTAHVVHGLMQFLMAVRYRKNVVLLALLVTGLAGWLYYQTATPYYRSTAAMLVMGSAGADGLPPSVAADDVRQRSLMATLQDLFTRKEVLERAAGNLPRHELVDFELARISPEDLPDVIRANLSATLVRGTRIIEVSYRAKAPRDAQTVVNAVVDSYRDFLKETSKGSAGDFSEILDEQKREQFKEIARKKQQRIRMQEQMGDIGIRSGSSVVHPLVQRAVYFNESLIDTQKKRIELETSLATIQAAIRNSENLQQHIMTVANVVGKEIMMRSLGFDQHDSYTQSTIERQLLDERAALTSMQEHLGPAHPDVIAIIDRIRLTEQYLLGHQQRVKERVRQLQRTELASMLTNMVRQKLVETRSLEESLEEKFNTARAEAIKLNGQLTELEMIEHELEGHRRLYDVLVEQIANTSLRGKGPEITTKVVQRPVEAAAPFSPNLRRVLVMALSAGLAAGLALVYVLDTLDDRFRSAEEMQQRIGVPVLAMVRQLPGSDAKGIDALPMSVDPNSAECEAFRTLRTALALANKEARKIVVSSAEPGDGKTTVLANLAVCYAQSDKRALLIDADLRRPGLTALMGLRGVEGLSGIMRGSTTVAAAAAEHVRPSGIPGLDILPSGPRPANPAELLANPRFAELLAWTETVYDQVLIDSPPALATSDTAVIGQLADGAVIVVRPDKNRRRMVLRAIQSLRDLKTELLGVVVNRIGADGDPDYYGYSKGYDYGYQYEGEYGAEEDAVDCSSGVVPRRAA